MIQLFKMLIIGVAIIPTLTFSQTNNNYIVISYSSICCGTPSKKPIIEYIIKFEKSCDLKPFEMFIESGLGKEGEYAFYIGTDNLNNKLTKSFLSGLKKIAICQNKQRVKNKDGYVNLSDKFMENSILKNIKDNPRTTISSLGIYNYKQ